MWLNNLKLSGLALDNIQEHSSFLCFQFTIIDCYRPSQANTSYDTVYLLEMEAIKQRNSSVERWFAFSYINLGK